MLGSGMQKGIFCVAHPDFENTKEITIVNVEYDEKFTAHLIDCA